MNVVYVMLCAQVLTFGTTAGDQVTVHSNAINATIGHSVLLPVTITLTSQFAKYTVEWEVGNQSILYHTVLNCTVDSLGYPDWILDDNLVMYPTFSHKVEFYRLNSSLLIYNFQLTDSGIYRISFSSTRLTTTQHIVVRVQSSVSDLAAASTWTLWIFAFWKVLCLIPLTALLIKGHVRG